MLEEAGLGYHCHLLAHPGRGRKLRPAPGEQRPGGGDAQLGGLTLREEELTRSVHQQEGLPPAGRERAGRPRLGFTGLPGFIAWKSEWPRSQDLGILEGISSPNPAAWSRSPEAENLPIHPALSIPPSTPPPHPCGQPLLTKVISDILARAGELCLISLVLAVTVAPLSPCPCPES